MAALPSLSRRALLLGGAAAAPPLRPPWALTGPEFAEACTGCGACILHCPEKVLGVGPGGFPVFDPRAGECTFCGGCVDACPPRALDRNAPARQHLAVVGEACLAGHGVVCSSCRDVCPERAILFPLLAAVAMPSIDEERCSGCGACVGVCPVTTITLQHRPAEFA